MRQLENQTLALAGIFQAAILIDELATKGSCNSTAFDGSFDSLFTFDTRTTEDVFGDIACLSRGFEGLSDYLGGQGKVSSRNIAYYVLSMMKIAIVVLRDARLSSELHDGLANIKSRSSEFDMPRSNVINKIDGLYQDSISKLEPRIMVRGEQNYLRNDNNAAKIRTLLLAGVRSAVLWKQLGGSKLKLFFARKKYVNAARNLLSRN